MPAAPLGRSDLRALEVLRRPTWIFDLDHGATWWANAAALALFEAETIDLLRARQLGDPMSEGMLRRLATYRAHFLRGEHVVEDWTFYPGNRGPVRASCACSGCPIVDETGERLAMLVEATVTDGGLSGDERRLVEALRHCNERISLYDPEGRVLMRNPAAEQTLGLAPAADADDAPTFEDACVERQDARAAFDAALAGMVFRREIHVRTTDGEAWYDTEARRVVDPVTGEPAVLCVQHDVSARRQSSEQLSRALREADTLRAQAESANRAKSAFLAMMSHELRTPMTGVLAAAELIRQSTLNDDQREILDMVLEGGQQMVGLVNDILDISRIEAGHLDIQPRSADPTQLLTDTLRPLHAAAIRKGLTIAHRQGDGVPDRVEIDPKRFSQIVTNLVGNAIKFSDEGTIEVSLTMLSEDRETLRLEVRDQGLGLGDMDVDRLFAPFDRGERADARGGAGLGLHIVRSITEAAGGRLGARNAPGGGALFWVEVPAPSTSLPAARPSLPGRGVQLKLSVLVVDDNRLNRRSIVRLLREWGCEVTEAEDGEDALERLSEDLDVVLMDVNMPRLDGPSAAAAIRQDELLPGSVPIVALTADVFFDLEGGPFDHLLTKPVDWEALRRLLTDLSPPR